MSKEHKQPHQPTRFARVAGQDTPFAEVVARAQHHNPTIRIFASPSVVDDYAWIDPVLQQVTTKETPAPPVDGLGFSGFTPAQRALICTGSPTRWRLRRWPS
ncbi:MAG: hypothetical protein IPK16_00445 [Anaerolineales bacterium]|nr:hypothetical protein [Anaerolineales bacterium]